MEGTPTATRIIVEDEAALAARLRADGFAVGLAADGLREVELCGRIAPGLVVRLLEDGSHHARSAGGRMVYPHVVAIRRMLGADVACTAQGNGYAFEDADAERSA